MSALDLDALEAETRKALRGVEPAYDFAGMEAKLERILRICARLRAAEARTAWQPIETAPRDCCVIGWGDEWVRPDVAWYCAGSWWSGCGSPCPEITHWQPLPAAPEAP